MHRTRRLFFLIGIVLCTIPVYAHHLAVVVPQDNHAAGISSVELGRILKSETRKWPNGNDVLVVIPKNSAVTLQVFEHLFSMSEAGVKALIAAHPASFIQADSDAAVRRRTANNRRRNFRTRPESQETPGRCGQPLRSSSGFE